MDLVREMSSCNMSGQQSVCTVGTKEVDIVKISEKEQKMKPVKMCLNVVVGIEKVTQKQAIVALKEGQ